MKKSTEKKKINLRGPLALLLAFLMVIGSNFGVFGTSEEASGNTGTEAEESGGSTGSGETSDSEFEKSIESFPESYKEYLRNIHSQYPNWVFVADLNGLDWSASVEAESKLGTSLVTKNAISSWKSTQSGAYDWSTSTWTLMDGSAWVQASPEIIAYFMDPRTYMTSASGMFAFLDYTYSPDTQTKAGLTRVVKGTFLAGSYKEDGVSYSYTDVIMEVAEKTNMNPYVIATTIRTEIGSAGTSNSISGTYSGYEGYYNYYNIGAYQDGDMNPIQRGLWYAKGSGTGATTWSRPWNTRYKAILGGAQFLVSSYVAKGQNTLYYKKFNVSPTTTKPYKHQYMTNIQSVNTQSSILAKAYDEDTRAEALVFKIPVYNNMPETATVKPTGTGSPNNRLKSLTVEGYSLSFSTDTLEYDLVVAWDTESISVSAKTYDSTATVTGTGTLKLGDSGDSFKIVVAAENGNLRTYTLNVAKEAAPKLPEQEDFYISEDNVLSGIVAFPMNAESFLSYFKVETGTASLVDADGNSLEGYVGTGCRAVVTDEAGEVISSYTILLYGDVNGDGRVTSADLLRLQKYILEETSLEDIYKAAADANRNGSVSSADLLTIQKSILGITTIVQ